MNWREHNKKISAETLEIIERGFYKNNGEKINLVGKNFDEAIVISPELSEKIAINISDFCVKTPPKIFVVDSDTFSMAESYDKKFLVMNFANAKYPGGGFLNGAYAQEESLCRQSTLYKSVSSSAAEEMYNYNHTHNKHCYSDYMIISPNVCVFRDIEYKFLYKPFLTSVITVPAPNLNGAAKNVPQEKIDAIMLNRLRKMFNAAIYYDYKDLVLGAWGCGAFGHNPYQVANYFYQLLFDEGYRYYFETIIFAIYDTGEKKNFNAFSEVFWNVSAKLSLDYDYGEQNFAEISATSANFYQNVFPHINFNFSAENFDEKNIGYAHGIMKNGLPFTAELWEYENVKNVAFYLPVIEEFFNVDEEIEKNKLNKVTGFSFDEEVQGFHSLCVGMIKTYFVASHEILDKYIDLLIACDLLKFTTNMRNGYGFILQDSTDNEFFCFTVSLQHKGEETAFTPLKWIPFKKNKTSALHLIK